MILNRLYELAVRESLLDDPAFETLPVFRRVAGDDDAGGIEGHGKQAAHLEQEGNGARIGNVFQVEAKILMPDRVVEDGADTVAGEDLADSGLNVGTDVKALRAGVGQQPDRPGNGGTFFEPGLVLAPDLVMESGG